jgi:restriction system protein
MPRYSDLMLPTLRAVAALGGSGNAREITARVLEDMAFSEELLERTYESRPTKSILLDRLDWARSYCKMSGTLESPRRGVFLMAPLGREVLDLPEQGAVQRLLELDRQVRAERRSADEDAPPPDEEGEDAAAASRVLREQVLERLHRLTPTAFEEFCLYLLRRYGLELTRTGGSGDEGIDGIGTAPISPVLSATVAVQAKRWEPSTVVSRDVVALLQRDAAAAGAERAVLVTLGKFSAPARRASQQATPTVDLIDGERLCDLVEEQAVGLVWTLDDAWFERFESISS